MRRILFEHSYEELISMDNLLVAWQEFVCGKRTKKDVQEFERDLMGNLYLLYKSLVEMNYEHSPYQAFVISDPKTRSIHKASVADRILHRAIYRQLYPFFDRIFIADSFSCRLGKGTHKALYRFEKFARRVSDNHHRTVWVLKCDIKKFFASVDQGILLRILNKRIVDKRIVWLIKQIIGSFSNGIGLPLGNLTSQLFANVYMNELDHYVKHQLRAKYYIRYADDFVILSREKDELEWRLRKIEQFLTGDLHLTLHPDKIELRTIVSGVDFLGWVHFSDHRVLRNTTKRRMLKRLESQPSQNVLASYRGLLRHGNTNKLQRHIL